LNASPLLSLTPIQLSKNFNVNLLSHFHTIRTFLPGMLSSPSGGTIVTVASVLGKLGAANLTDYTAAKAGLIAMHASLRAELSSPLAESGAANIRTILVTPGQLSTPLFAGVETPSNFFGPVVEPVELARAIVEMVERGVSGEVSLPFYARSIGVLQVLPWSLQRVARWASGADRAMDGLVRARGKRE
jgi:NAD(P)-dependent dehydrogenase (short-subunit alcohol dehydrogenase family)